MKHDGIIVTPYNYKQLYREYNKDIQEEIYYALGDNVDIDKYIPVADDIGILGAPWLSQVRKALSEGLPNKYFKIHSDRVILYFRAVNSSTPQSLHLINPYIDMGFSERQWVLILKWFLDSVDSEYITKTLPVVYLLSEDELQGVDDAIRSGYPIWEAYANGAISEYRAQLCISLMRMSRWKSEYAGYSTDLLESLQSLPTQLFITLSSSISCDTPAVLLSRVVQNCRSLPTSVILRLLNPVGNSGNYGIGSGVNEVSARKGPRTGYWPEWFVSRVANACDRGWNIEEYFDLGPNCSMKDVSVLDDRNSYDDSVGHAHGSLSGVV